MRAKTVGRATAAAAAIGTVLAPTAAAGAEAGRPTAASPPAPASAAETGPNKCSQATDYRLQKSAYLTDTVTGAVSPDQVHLFYSPSSRCVWGKFSIGADRCRTPVEPDPCAGASMTVIDANGNIEQFHPSCFVNASVYGCWTQQIDDAGKRATVEGVRNIGAGPNHYMYGKTEWW